MFQAVAAAVLFAAAAAPTPAEFKADGWEQTGAWYYKEAKDPITDKRRALSATVGEGGAMLLVKCDEAAPGSVYVSFMPDGYLGSGRSTGDRRPVVFRFDQDPPVEVLWRYGDTSALLIDRPAAFTRELLGGTKSSVVVRATSYRYATFTDKFSLEGASKVVLRVYNVCEGATPG